MHSVECWGLTVRGKIDYCICGYGPSREEDERIQELESQLKTLQEKLERAKEALRFYAERDNEAWELSSKAAACLAELEGV